MPTARIISNDLTHTSKKILKELERRGIITRCSVLGTQVYGRYYLTKRQLRQAYYDQLPKIELKKERKKLAWKMKKKSNGKKIPMFTLAGVTKTVTSPGKEPIEKIL